MAVTVVPEEFTYVTFEAPAIEALLAGLLDRLGMADRALRMEINEASPVVRIAADDGDPIVMRADSGAFEEPRRPRSLSDDNVVTNGGRVLLRLRDRSDGSFADAPAEADLTLAQTAAWDTYSVGRIGRLGYHVHQPRWRYNFRNRHGFSDATDATFDRLWGTDRLTWVELSALSDGAVAASAAPAASAAS
jgi:hypothetical protein